jgi:lipopolysaccharide/colanic/teichoic acid biosynthesis glycosyltransferase
LWGALSQDGLDWLTPGWFSTESYKPLGFTRRRCAINTQFHLSPTASTDLGTQEWLEIRDSNALDMRISGDNVDDAFVGRADPLAGPVPVARERYYIAKRIIDLILASILILICIPILLIIVVAIRFDSPGPIIFAQQRLRGRRTRSDGAWVWSLDTFTLYKFRTMETNADPSFHRNYMAAYLAGDEAGLMMLRPGRKVGDSYRPLNDPRVTRVGAILRKLSLDELPQLWNVMQGEMSLVGPRPPLLYEVEMYEERHLRRMVSPPGVTGWAQVRGRCALDFEDTVRLDLEYIARQSLWFDLKILLMTAPVVLSKKGAD